MRIAFVSVSSQLGGSEAVLLQLLNGLPAVRPDWQLHLLAPAEGPLVSRARAADATVHLVPMPPALARLGESVPDRRMTRLARGLAGAALGIRGYERKIAAVLEQIAPEVVHSNGLKAHVVAARSRMPGRRLWHLHDYLSPRPVSRRLLRHYGARCDAWVANSASVAADARRIIGERPGRPEVIVPNGVDLPQFAAPGEVLDLDRLSGLAAAPEGTLRVGLVATFARWKGHEVFLRAIAQLPPALPVRGYVIGGPLYDTGGSQYSLDELRKMARDLGCQDRVGFTGFQESAPAAMRALDVVVHASTEPEPFGLVLIEAMAAGRPLITSGTGGAGEIVTPGVNAIVHTAGDPESLADAIRTLVDEPSTRARLAAAGRVRAAAYDGGIFIDRFAAIFEQTAAL